MLGEASREGALTPQAMVQTLKALRSEVTEKIDYVISLVAPWTPREYSASVDIEPGSAVSIDMGTEYVVPGTSVFGLLETAQKEFGIEHEFIVKRLIVDDADVADLVFQSLYVGTRAMWRIGADVPASKFAASAKEPIEFDQHAQKGLRVAVRVCNPTNEKRTIRVKIAGKERVFAEASR